MREYEQRETSLNSEIEELQNRLEAAKKANSAEEQKLNNNYGTADNAYNDTLETYD